MTFAPNADSLLVIEAGRKIGVLSITTGSLYKILQQAAEAHAAYQASVCTQGHFEWEYRYAVLTRHFPGHEISEIVAESWAHNSREEAAPEMFNSWRQSSGHWAVANWQSCFYGYSMAKGSNGIWYGCGTCARGRR